MDNSQRYERARGVQERPRSASLPTVLPSNDARLPSGPSVAVPVLAPSPDLLKSAIPVESPSTINLHPSVRIGTGSNVAVSPATSSLPIAAEAVAAVAAAEAAAQAATAASSAASAAATVAIAAIKASGGMPPSTFVPVQATLQHLTSLPAAPDIVGGSRDATPAFQLSSPNPQSQFSCLLAVCLTRPSTPGTARPHIFLVRQFRLGRQFRLSRQFRLVRRYRQVEWEYRVENDAWAGVP